MLVILFMITISLIFLFFVLLIFEPKLKVKKRIDVFVSPEKADEKAEGKARDGYEEETEKRHKSVLMPKIKDFFGARLTSDKEESIEKKLLQAGNPFGMTPIDFQVFSFAIKVFLPILFGLYGRLVGLSAVWIIFLTLIALILSSFLPNFYINQKIKKRYKQALRELPDFLDLLTVCLEAGLGFDASISKVISKNNGILSNEFHICLEEIRLGKTRKEAMSGIKERLAFDELKSLINNIIQAEKLGLGMVQVLRIKSQEEREKRKQRAEEEAMKAPIKILFPLVLFIFPSIFIVLLGPALIQLLNGFGK